MRGHPAPPPPFADDDDFRVLAVDVVQPRPFAPGVALAALPGYPVFISRAAVTNMLRHAERGLETGQEVAGGLVGVPGRHPGDGRPFTQVRAALAVHGRADAHEVEIPPEEWARLSAATGPGSLYSGTVLIGWYHSHPTLAAYLSPLDRQTQQQFFPELWHIAIVVAPLLRQVRAYHGGAGQECALYLDPGETGGTLVPVTYEVSAGAVSTPLGIEWLHPPSTAALPTSDYLAATIPAPRPARGARGPQPRPTMDAPGRSPAPSRADGAPGTDEAAQVNRVAGLIGLLILAVLVAMLLVVGGALLLR